MFWGLDMASFTKTLAVLIFGILPVSNAAAATIVQTGGASHTGTINASFQKYANNAADPLLAVIFEQKATGGTVATRVFFTGEVGEEKTFKISSTTTGISFIQGSGFQFNTPMSGSSIVSAKSGELISTGATGFSTHTYNDSSDLSFFIGGGSFQTHALATVAVGTVELLGDPTPYPFTPFFVKQNYMYAYKLTYVTGGPDVGAIPEPSTWMMLIFGFFVVGTSVRRQRFGVARLQAHT